MVDVDTKNNNPVKKNKKSLKKMAKISSFLATNLLGTVVDTLVLWVFSDFVFHNYWGQYYISPLISFECAVTTNFISFYFFTWRDRIKVRTFKRFLKKYVFFNLSSTGVFLFKMLILITLERIFGWDVVICNLVALCVSGVINFVMDEWVIFKKSKKVTT